jgi:hypothetical protein
MIAADRLLNCGLPYRLNSPPRLFVKTARGAGCAAPGPRDKKAASSGF